MDGAAVVLAATTGAATTCSTLVWAASATGAAAACGCWLDPTTLHQCITTLSRSFPATQLAIISFVIWAVAGVPWTTDLVAVAALRPFVWIPRDACTPPSSLTPLPHITSNNNATLGANLADASTESGVVTSKAVAAVWRSSGSAAVSSALVSLGNHISSIERPTILGSGRSPWDAVFR